MKKNPTLLVLDSSTDQCSITLFNNKRIYSHVEKQPNKQAQIILPMIAHLCEKALIQPTDLDGIAYGYGPGSFTGLRIVASVSQALCLASSSLAFGISTLAAQSWQAYKTHGWTHCLSLINAHMGEVFWAYYKIIDDHPTLINKENLSSPELISPIDNTSLAKWTAIGNATHLLPSMPLSVQKKIAQTDSTIRPLTESMLDLALSAYHLGCFSKPEKHLPIYLRESIAWKKLSDQPSLIKTVS